jgi:hypothetical protein
MSAFFFFAVWIEGRGQFLGGSGWEGVNFFWEGGGQGGGRFGGLGEWMGGRFFYRGAYPSTLPLLNCFRFVSVQLLS